LAKKKHKPFQINPGANKPSGIIDANLPVLPRGERVNVCFKYYDKGHECLSTWQQPQIKKFSNWLEKISQRTAKEVKSTTQTCHRHLGKPKKVLPRGLSLDVEIYGLDVGAGERVHGAFVGDNFFVIWLDRGHNFHR
jgi:hypothetical protein